MIQTFRSRRVTPLKTKFLNPSSFSRRATPDVALNFKVTQRRDLSIEVEYVPGAVELPQSVVRNFEKSVGAEVPVMFRKVDSIAHDRGKIRYVVRER